MVSVSFGPILPESPVQKCRNITQYQKDICLALFACPMVAGNSMNPKKKVDMAVTLFSMVSIFFAL